MASFDRSILTQPRWILAMVVGLLLAVGFVRLGLWQLDRLDERRAENAVIEDRLAEPARHLEGILGQYGENADEMVHRHATARGTFRTQDEFFAVGRTYDDLTGTLVATPFDRDDGTVLIVIRGLVPPDTAGPPAEGFGPPSGEVVVSGVLDDGEDPTAFAEPEPDDGHLTSVSRLDLAYIDQWVEGDVLPVTLVLGETEPSHPGRTPEPVPRPEITEGPHLGYAIQWFAFALIVAGGVAALVYRAGTAEGSG